MVKCDYCDSLAHYMDMDKDLTACEEHLHKYAEPYAECFDCCINIRGYHFTYETHIFCFACYKDRTKAEFEAQVRQ